MLASFQKADIPGFAFAISPGADCGWAAAPRNENERREIENWTRKVVRKEAVDREYSK